MLDKSKLPSSYGKPEIPQVGSGNRIPDRCEGYVNSREFFEFLRDLDDEALEKKVLEVARIQTGDPDVTLVYGLTPEYSWMGGEIILTGKKKKRADHNYRLDVNAVLRYILFQQLPKGA